MTPTQSLTLITSLFIASSAFAEPYTGNMSGLIATPSTASAEVRVLEVSQEIRELNERINRSAEQNKDWFEDYRKNLTPGEPLPYHQNLGITEAEFKQLMGDGWSEELVATGNAKMSFTWREDEVLSISGLPEESPYDSILYEPVSDTIMTRYGQFTGSAPAAGIIGNDQSMEWDGRVWTLKRSGRNGEVTLHFVMGRLKSTNQSVLIHEAYGELNDQPVQNHYVLVWE